MKDNKRIIGAKKLKAVASFLTAMFIILGCTIRPRATETTIDNVEAIIENNEENNEIDHLFALRRDLELEYEKNVSAINNIDLQLAALGVEEITTFELASKMGIDSIPRFSVDSTSTTQWTSRRVIETYYGKQYELQIIEGIPTSPSSPLRKNYSQVSYKAEGVVAGIAKAIKVVGATALGATPIIGDTLSLGVTAYDAFNAVVDSLSTSSTIDEVSGTAMVSFTSHMKFVFVKEYGVADTGNQVLCYVGNEVAYLVTAISVVDITENGKLCTYHNISTSRNDSSTSQYYNSYSIPAQNYYDYKTNGNNYFTYDYHITHITMSLFGNNTRFATPYEYANIT